MNKEQQTITARERFVWVIVGAVGYALILTLFPPADGAEFYENEPRSSGYVFQVSTTCPDDVVPVVEKSAVRFSTFVKNEVSGRTTNTLGYDGVNLITCVDSFTSANALRLPCWNDRGLYACESELYSESDGAVIGRATWWRASRESKVFLECDIQLIPGVNYFQHVANHEFGHCNGLAHNTELMDTMMYPTVVFNTGFHYDDIQGLCHLYHCKTDVADDHGRIVIREVVRPGQPEVWTGVISIWKVIQATELE